MPLVIARAPLRIDLAGPSKAAPLYSRAYPALAVNAAINRYCYVVADEPADGGLYIDSADFGLSERCIHGVLIEIGEPLQIAKAAIEYFGDRGLYDRGVSLFLSSQEQSGSGLGVSSAMAVALVRALTTYLGLSPGTEEIAEIAGWLETERLGMTGGREDHYVSAHGGVQRVLTSGGETSARSIGMPSPAQSALTSSMLLVRVPGGVDTAGESSQALDPGAVRALHELSSLAEEMESALEAGDLAMVGRLLDAAWEYRRRLVPQEHREELDRIYSLAREAGAAGARLSGRGSLLVFSPPERREHVRAALTGRGLEEISFSLTDEGARVLTGNGEPSSAREIIAERVFPDWTPQERSAERSVSSDRDRLRSS